MFDEVYVGGFEEETLTEKFGDPDFFIGYISSFMFGKYDIMLEMEGQQDPNIHRGQTFLSCHYFILNLNGLIVSLQETDSLYFRPSIEIVNTTELRLGHFPR